MTLFHDVPICLSGGAKGADEQWGMCAGMAGHQVFHFSFWGHKMNVPESEAVILKKEQLAIADPFLEKANETLKRKWPVSNVHVANLLRRNYHQVSESQSLYAVASIDKRGCVTGGTGWAVQMFLDRVGPSALAYVFDQEADGWYAWKNGVWMPVMEPPEPTGIWAGIGSRELKQNGKQAIRKLMKYVPVEA